MKLLPLVLAGALVATGCARTTARTPGGTDVVAGIYPLAFVAERVGGAKVHVTTLTPPGAEPHDIELSPAQVGEVEQADLVLLVHGLQAALDAAARGDHVLDALSVGTPAAGSPANDPHVWLDPVRLRDIANAVAARLGTSADALVADLDRLDADIRAALRGCARQDIVTSHEAFGQFAARYGLRQVGIAGLSPEAEPSPGRLAEIAAYVRDHHVTTIFTEALVSPKVAETVAREAHVRTAVLDPIESVKDGDDYFTVMRRNVATLHTALGCT
jgi:zinc transport system substrate-binding protein